MNKSTEATKSSGTEKSAVGHTHGEPLRGASIEDLSTRLTHMEGVNQDMATFIAHNWKRLTGGLGIVLLGIIVYYQYIGTQEKRVGEAAQRFSEAELQYASLLAGVGASDPQKVGEQTTALLSNLKSLASSHGDQSYGKFSELFAAAVHLQQKNITAAQAELDKLPTPSFASITSAKSATEVAQNSLTDELNALLRARLILQSENGDLNAARKQLEGIVLGGRFLNGEALIALYRIADSDALKGSAKETAEKLLAARPELRETLTSTLSNLGISLTE